MRSGYEGLIQIHAVAPQPTTPVYEPNGKQNQEDKMRIAIITSDRIAALSDRPWQAVMDGLIRCGHDVRVVVPGSWPLLSGHVDAVFIWNGMKRFAPSLVSRFRSQGTAVIICERGFFQRLQYTQLDYIGFSHTASWVEQLAKPSPPQGRVRLFKVLGNHPIRQLRRSDGYILVLGQVSGDAQLAGAELRCSSALRDAVVKAAPAGMKVVLRHHPLCHVSRQGSLCEAVRGARFCVTINSNSANEAIASGCPVMALGPSLFTMAKVALPATVENLRQQLQIMADGWCVGNNQAFNYLNHLACRQFNEAEIREGSVLRSILGSNTEE